MKPRLATDDTHTAALATDIRVLVSKLKRRFREKANMGDLTLSQLAVLRRLDSDGPTTVTNLARAEGMRPQSMGANIAALEAAGLVSGAPDPNDGRQTILSLTAACREKVKVVRMAYDVWLIEALQRTLSPTEQHELARAIELLKRLVES
jgi:DNA-binding MarR family transcriptional regulator